MKHNKLTPMIIALLTGFYGIANGSEVTIPNSFVAGTPANAEDVNANFDALATSVNDNNTRVTANEGNITANTTSIGNKANTADVYTKTETDAKIAADIAGKANSADVYTQAETDAKIAADIAGKANSADVYTSGAADTAIANAVAPVATNVTNLQEHANGSANGCQGNDINDIMVRVGNLCVDKYEASVWDSTNATQYGDKNFDGDTADGGEVAIPCSANGNDCPAVTWPAQTTNTNAIFARSVKGVTPTSSISWFQAAQACANAGKRLLTNAEWQVAAAGSPNPSGGAGADTANECNTQTAAAVNTGSSEGGANECVSNWGAMDMVGNVHEWVADWIQGTTTSTTGNHDHAAAVAIDGAHGGHITPSTGNAAGAYGNDSMFANPAANQADSVAPNTTTSTNFLAAIYRGGAWGAGDGAGVFALYSTTAPSYQVQTVGFRCAR